ncbi:MAG: nickel-dependent hydrogenase large subunit [Anaerolineae bacterium]
MATQRVVIDPISRIEGHLRVEVEAADGKIAGAWTPCTQFRGIELVLKGRDPRDAWVFAQRICGVCTTMHALAAIYAVEDALDYPIPPQAKAIRNLISLSQMIQDHVIHFYHLQALDWVNVVNAAKADPAKAAALGAQMSNWPLNGVGAMTQVKEQVTSLLNSGQLSIFTNGYWSHPGYRLPPEADLLALAHYLQALDFQREMIKVQTIFGGKNPHPNFLVGGMACAINMDNQWTINQVRLDVINKLVDQTLEFVEQVYLPDVLAIGGFYKDYTAIGAANPNLMQAGLPGYAGPGAPRENAGVLLDGNYTDVQPFDPGKIAEYVNSAWYSYTVGNDTALPPARGETVPDYTGPTPPFEWLADREKYSWTKIPRYDGYAMQLGPNARMLIGYAQGNPDIVPLVDDALQKLGVPASALNSTMGRTLARALESVYCARQYRIVFDRFVEAIKAGQTATFNSAKWDPTSWPDTAQGFGMVEAPRGTLGHWVRIENGQIANYQAVVPSTWNSSGTDPSGVPGPFAYSLSEGGNHPLVDPAAPLEVLRTIHSFDPCMSCAVQVTDVTGAPITEVRVL